ncbi:MAG: GNAT family N-acetyltransferase, partial [Proteocatella sp.]
FIDNSDSIVSINRTFVDSSIKNQGIASKLMESLALKLRDEGKKAYPLCSYAVQWFEKNPQYSDLIS